MVLDIQDNFPVFTDERKYVLFGIIPGVLSVAVCIFAPMLVLMENSGEDKAIYIMGILVYVTTRPPLFILLALANTVPGDAINFGLEIYLVVLFGIVYGLYSMCDWT